MDFGNIIHIAPSNQNTSNILSESKKKNTYKKVIINTQYMTNQTIVYLVKMEYG